MTGAAGTSAADHRASWLHQAPAHHKVLAAVLVVVSVVATPSGTWWPYAVAGAVLLAAAFGILRLRPVVVLRRMSVEIPFLAFAVLLPFVAEGDRIDVAGVSLSRPGLLAAGAIAAKATIGVLTAIVLASSTPAPAIIGGLRRLRLPALLVSIAGFMVRYLDVVVDDARRMRIARESRAFTSSHLGHARAVAAGAGTLFVRSYERGERVHLAMLARGFTGSMPDLDPPRNVTGRATARLFLPVALVAGCVALSWVLR